MDCKEPSLQIRTTTGRISGPSSICIWTPFRALIKCYRSRVAITARTLFYATGHGSRIKSQALEKRVVLGAENRLILCTARSVRRGLTRKGSPHSLLRLRKLTLGVFTYSRQRLAVTTCSMTCGKQRRTQSFKGQYSSAGGGMNFISAKETTHG